ncbi:hypothetical protein F5Y18DRAFT_424072 [Xylariaceae sp. FL1019]|nr:hypothetical protein F5Y18DRAFT_424072 [Xylariaceae sp. FL1019]
MSTSSVSLDRFPILSESMCQLYQDIASYAWMQYRCIMTPDDCEKMLSEAKWDSVDDYIEHNHKAGIKRSSTPLDPRFIGRIDTNGKSGASNKQVETVTAKSDQNNFSRNDGAPVHEAVAVGNVVALGKYNVYVAPDEVDDFHLANGDDVVDIVRVVSLPSLRIINPRTISNSSDPSYTRDISFESFSIRRLTQYGSSLTISGSMSQAGSHQSSTRFLQSCKGRLRRVAAMFKGKLAKMRKSST